MLLNFRQGVVRGEKNLNGTPRYLAMSPSGVDVVVDQAYLILALSHGTTNYLLQETRSVAGAWPSPFPSGTAYLYVDLSLQTGVRTFGYTRRRPSTGFTEPPNAGEGDHWFNASTNTMMLRLASGKWIPKVRLFLGEVSNGATLLTYGFGSSVGMQSPSASIPAGFILYDDELKPVRKADPSGFGQFLTTETPLASQLMRMANYRIETGVQTAIARNYIPRWSPVCYVGPNVIDIARNVSPDFPCVGIADEEIGAGDVAAFITAGYAQDADWDWTASPSSFVFVGADGTLTTTVPQSGSMQRVATIVDPNQILVKIEPIMIYA
jgi:hypothetical protein